MGSVGRLSQFPPYGLGSAAAAAAAAAASTTGFKHPFAIENIIGRDYKGVLQAGGLPLASVMHHLGYPVPGQLSNVVGSVWPHVGVMDSVAAAAAVPLGKPEPASCTGAHQAHACATTRDHAAAGVVCPHGVAAAACSLHRVRGRRLTHSPSLGAHRSRQG